VRKGVGCRLFFSKVSVPAIVTTACPHPPHALPAPAPTQDEWCGPCHFSRMSSSFIGPAHCLNPFWVFSFQPYLILFRAGYLGRCFLSKTMTLFIPGIYFNVPFMISFHQPSCACYLSSDIQPHHWIPQVVFLCTRMCHSFGIWNFTYGAHFSHRSAVSVFAFLPTAFPA
jgi:hypothetical protein